MPQKSTISFAASAVKDTEEIRMWYARQNAAAVGECLMLEIISAVERLADFPEGGRIVPEFGIANLREVLRPPFRIVYRLDRHKVRIVRVWRSERLLKTP